ncbi:urease accessory protein [Actinoplanes tereljensis]|uniref:Urease accessory protein UreD n=1 Tax=Paractinoplanes tereljensis TaxID=571912 RepID=A0A919NG05_9ACTN|nr:urease accessory protein UreD [Actinoplanes tereljensis]GIF17503.1 urease accessory protein UreD [Actinoplanes tereljensis]
MQAFAQVVAEADGRGGTRLAVLRGESPLLLRRTGGRSGGDATVHLVGGAAGPLRGDDLRLEVVVGEGAHLTVRSVAAQLALPGRPAPASRLVIHATVAGTLRWLPEPLIAAAGCDHHTSTVVEVAEGGELLWRDDLVCGRHAEPSGDARLDTTIRYAGRTLYRHDLGVGRHADGWDGAAVLGGGRAVGTVVAIPGLPGVLPASPHAALMPLAGPGVLATAVGVDIRQVQAALGPLCEPAGAARTVMEAA